MWRRRECLPRCNNEVARWRWGGDMKDRKGPEGEVVVRLESSTGALYRALVEAEGSECYDSARTMT